MNSEAVMSVRRVRRARPGETPLRWMTLAFERYALVIILGAIVLFFSLDPKTSATFPTAGNVRNVIGDQSVLVIVALASLFPLICGEFDFSVGATATASQVAVAAAAGKHHLNLTVAIVIAIAVGLAIGVVNSLIVTRVGVSGIITTLGVGTLLLGLVTLYTHGAAIVANIPVSLTNFGDNLLIGIPTITICTLVVALVIMYFLTSTPSGRYLYSVGSNREAARLVGLPVRGLVGGSFVLSGTLAGVAGVLMVARTGVGDPQVGGTTLTLQALSAAFLGATAIRPGRFNVVGTVVAVFFIAFSVSGLSLIGASGWVSDVFTGTALIVAVAVSTYFARRRQQSPVGA